jgi:hypothetical protein
MNAEEAREKTIALIKSAIESQYNNVKCEIEDAVMAKCFKATHYGTLKPEVISLLKDEGFTVQSMSGRPGDDCETIISW